MTTHEPVAPQPAAPEIEIGESFQALAAQLVGEVQAYLSPPDEETATLPTTAIIQPEAYSEREEAERDYLLEQLKAALGIDVDGAMTEFERMWAAGREAAEDEAAAERFSVTIPPWMKDALGMDNPDRPTVLRQSGILRSARLNFAGQAPLTIRELEIPNRVTGSDGSRDRMNRVMWFTAD